MALVNINNMVVLDNPTAFNSMFQFEITFECLQELDDDLEWKVLYVVNAEDKSKDLVLDEILVGPVPVGINKFILQADAPDPTQLSSSSVADILGVTVVLVTCSYKEREFIRVGYYVNNDYHDPNNVAAATTTTTNEEEEAGTTTAISLEGDEAADNEEDDDEEDEEEENDEAKEMEKTDSSSKKSEGGAEKQEQKTTPQQSSKPSAPSLPSLANLDFSKIIRTILADKPRVTKFPIPWDDAADANINNNDLGAEGEDNDNGAMTIGDENQAPSSDAQDMDVDASSEQQRKNAPEASE